MIVAISNKTQYGKQGTASVNHMPEVDEESVIYAHSMDEALAWAKGYPLYENVKPESLGDGRILITSAWTEDVGYGSFLWGTGDVTHTRQQLVIYPVNTAFVSTGFSGSKR